MEGPILAGDALADDLGVFVHEHGWGCGLRCKVGQLLASTGSSRQ
jgi:hypothetical protein